MRTRELRAVINKEPSKFRRVVIVKDFVATRKNHIGLREAKELLDETHHLKKPGRVIINKLITEGYIKHQLL